MKNGSRLPVVAVVGPTASGKTRLAVELARVYGGEVISADSMQIYRGMEIATAQPTQEEMGGIPHHLIGFRDPSQPFSVAEYVTLAKECIGDISRRGKLPVLAGGTGLYVRSLLHNTKFAGNDRDDGLRQELRKKAETEGAESLLRELREFDPDSADRLHPHNLSRIIRAIEVYRLTGKTMTEQIKESHEEPSPYNACVVGLCFRDRSVLYGRIDRRVDGMLESGLLGEALRVLSGPGGATSLQAIGYKELKPYFEGEISLEEVVSRVKQETRRYAKRQMTWFRRDEEVRWIEADECEDFGEILRRARKYVEDSKIL